MTGHNRGQSSAAPSVLGYFYQCRYALLEALRRLSEGERICIGVETLGTGVTSCIVNIMVGQQSDLGEFACKNVNRSI